MYTVRLEMVLQMLKLHDLPTISTTSDQEALQNLQYKVRGCAEFMSLYIIAIAWANNAFCFTSTYYAGKAKDGGM